MLRMRFAPQTTLPAAPAVLTQSEAPPARCSKIRLDCNRATCYQSVDIIPNGKCGGRAPSGTACTRKD